MTDAATHAEPHLPERSVPTTTPAGLTPQQKAAVVIGVLGPEAAAPVLEQLDDLALRNFTQAMSRLRRIEPETVRRTVAEFLDELERSRQSVRGGFETVREMLKPMLSEAELTRMLDEADAPSVNNVWKKLSKVNENALADFLMREHPQTAALILSKLSSEHAAKVLSRMPSEAARSMVVGLTRASSLDANVIEAIGSSVSRDFLSSHQHSGPRRNPADRIGAIMNFTAPDTRDHVLEHLVENQPELAEEVKRKMFTFEDIPKRVPTKSVSAIVGVLDREILLKALAGAEESAPASRAFLLDNLASRVGSQVKEGLEELGNVGRRESESAQTEVVRAIRALEAKGELKLIKEDEEG